MSYSRRRWLQAMGTAGLLATADLSATSAAPAASNPAPLKITDLTVTPIALPDPPLLNAGGCHGPYFLRNIVQLTTDAGIVGIGETTGGEGVTMALEKSRDLVRGKNAFAIRSLRTALDKLNTAAYT